MRFVALALILLSLPIFVVLLQQDKRRRDLAVTALGVMFFMAGQLQIDAAIISWPLWTGSVRGIQISLIDTLALALLVTRRANLSKLPLLWIFLAQIGVLSLSVATSTMPLASTFTWVQFIRVTVVFLALGGEMARSTAFTALFKGLALGLMVQAGFVIEQKLTGVVQASGTVGHQNLLGIMTELVLINLIAALLEGERHILIKIGIVAGGIIIVGGGSRGAMAMVGVATAVLALLSLARNLSPRKMKLLGLGMLLLACLVPLGMMTLKERFGNTSVLSEEQQRLAMESAAHAIAKDYPLGVGSNLYANVSNMQHYADRAGVAWNLANRSVPVHNIYLLTRAETGLLGEIVFVLFLAIPALTALTFAFRYRKTREGGYALGSAVTIITTAVHGMYEFSLSVYPGLILLTANFAIIAAVVRNARTRPRRVPVASASMINGPRGRPASPAAWTPEQPVAAR